MKVILKEDVNKLGKAGDIKNVADGYARNYLLPHNLAWEANDGNIKRWEVEKKRREQLVNQQLLKLKQLADKISKLSCTITVKTDNEEKIFGSVTNNDIAESLAAKGIAVDKKDVLLEEPIRQVGVYNTKIKLSPEVFAELKVWVVAEKPEENNIKVE